MASLASQLEAKVVARQGKAHSKSKLLLVGANSAAYLKIKNILNFNAAQASIKLASY